MVWSEYFESRAGGGDIDLSFFVSGFVPTLDPHAVPLGTSSLPMTATGLGPEDF